MSEKRFMYDSAGGVYESGELILTRQDGTRVFRLSPSDQPLRWNVNVMVIPPLEHPILHSADILRIRSQFSSASRTSPPAVLYPQALLTDDFGDHHGYLAWLPPEMTRLIPITEYASEPHRQLKAAKALAGLFSSMENSRALLSMVDPDGFFINDQGTAACYVSADVPHASMQLHPDYIHHVPPELLVCNRCADGMNATAVTADYVLSVLLYRLLLKDYPFAGENPADLICDGISVFYDDSTEAYQHCMEQLTNLDPELIRMFRRAFDYCSRSAYDSGRPTADDWYTTLSDILTRKYGGA